MTIEHHSVTDARRQVTWTRAVESSMPQDCWGLVFFRIQGNRTWCFPDLSPEVCQFLLDKMNSTGIPGDGEVSNDFLVAFLDNAYAEIFGVDWKHTDDGIPLLTSGITIS